MDDNLAFTQVDEAQSPIQALDAADSPEERGLRSSREAAATITDPFIAIIESRSFIRECIRRSMESAFPLKIQTFSEAIELERKRGDLPRLIVLSEAPDSKETDANLFNTLSQIAPKIPIIVVAYNNDIKMAKAAISYGAKGYIPVTLGFEIAIEAVRFVLAGGTYVPIDYLLRSHEELPSEALSDSDLVTARELAVIREIQRGKSNKIIAYNLGMCESTVKVHVRRIMKKLNAKNRTDVAIKWQTVSISNTSPTNQVATRGGLPTRGYIDPPAPQTGGRKSLFGDERALTSTEGNQRPSAI